MKRFACLFSCLALGAFAARGDEAQLLAAVEIRAQADSPLGDAAAASAGVVSGQRLRAQALQQPGEALETVPGLVVTQHSGEGKANQYFLRGFNLDHGTDFATFVAGVPVNMPSHAHGQGYTDLNFLIPELVDKISFRKGPYYADEGDFASAGAAHIDYLRRLDAGLAQLTLGQDGLARGLLAGSPQAGQGRLLYGLEWSHQDGPWEVPEDFRKFNAVLRYSQGEPEAGLALTAMAYRGAWTSTDQIPERAIAAGLVGRYASLDPSSGGKSQRYSLAADWAGRGESSRSRAGAWLLASDLDLWSDFQYCLNRGCPPGDQFKQAERRLAGGLAASHVFPGDWGGTESESAIGLQARIDRLRPVGLYATAGRDLVATLREDRVQQSSFSLWAQTEVRWSPWLRTIAGLRGDAYDFRVTSSLPANSGKTAEQILTPKFSLVLGPWRRTEIYFDYGHGFHSNDARGATARVDPADGTTPVEAAKPLARSRGAEIGLRSEALPGWQSGAALWRLEVESELVFAGDTGTTQAARPSRRQGLEWSNSYSARDWLHLDADFSWSQARFRGQAPGGDHVPGAVGKTALVAIRLDPAGPWSAALRLRYFGPRPLVEDNTVRSAGSTLANLRLSYRLASGTRLALDVFNLFDRRVNGIEYWYASQLPGEAAPVFDRHVHPGEPRTLRLSLSHSF